MRGVFLVRGRPPADTRLLAGADDTVASTAEALGPEVVPGRCDPNRLGFTTQAGVVRRLTSADNVTPDGLETWTGI